jgi:CheY-like chemotaxis protein
MRKRTILIAEDDPDDQLIIRDVLEDLLIPETVHIFEDGQKLLNYLCGQIHLARLDPQPGILLLDLRMPGKNGFEVLQDLRAHPIWKWLPVVILSTSSQQEDKQLAYRCGANGYFVKSPHYKELRETLKIIHAYWLKGGLLPDYQEPLIPE